MTSCPRARLAAALIGPVLLGAACGSPRPLPASAIPPASPPSTPAPGATHASLLIGPSWFAVLATEPSRAQAPATYGLALSPQTAVLVPGYGSLTLEQARASGGRPLAAAAVSGLLGIALDRSAVVPDASPPPLLAGTAYGRLPLRPTPAEVQELVSAHLAGARLTAERAFARRVELRDGTGSPAAARQASLLLAASGFVTAGEAPAGDGTVASTRIVVYSGTAASTRIGGEAAEALGTGAVAVSGQESPHSPDSGVVDVTVVLGADFVAQGVAQGNARGAPQGAG